MPDSPNIAEPGKPRRHWYRSGTRTLLVVVMLCFVVWAIRWGKPIGHLPGFSADGSDVARMTATLFGADGDGHENGKDVSLSQVPLVLETLAEGRVDQEPAKWEVVGQLKCRMNSGQTLPILLFYVSDKEWAFRTDQQHYFRGVDAHKLAALLGW